MELRDFYKIRAGLQMNAPSAPAAALVTMEQTLRDALLSSNLLHSVEVDRTDDPDRRLIAMVGFAPDLDTASVAHELERLWAERVHYAHWEAHALLVEDDQVELQAGTLVSKDGYHVTVHVVAQRSEVPTVTEPEVVAPVMIPVQPSPAVRRPKVGLFRRLAAPAELP